MGMLKDFLRLEAAGGVLLFATAVLGLVAANSLFSGWYGGLLDTTVAVQIGALAINKPFILWINDGLMAVFFFLIGLEVKREVLEGELSSPDQIILPGLGAIGGISAPAVVYSLLNWDNPVAMSGWAVASATDIAFALGILSLFGKRVPPTLKIFLLTLAIFDDLAAIAIIAVFYAGDLSLSMLGLAAVILVCGVAANLLGVRRTSVYLLIGVALWVTVLQSGVHATLAGVLIALCVPLREEGGHSPLKSVEADLHTPVAYFILPLFAFANAGLALSGMGLQDLTSPVALGIIGGLVLGNPIGILLLTGAGVALGFTKLPPGVNWLQMAGVSFICGVGFTMSLFIAGLAFEHAGGAYYDVVRLGILIGSTIAGILGSLLLWLGIRNGPAHPDAE
ncbi:MAG: Na+/H+ antiporter NhaA [Gammaproteobacteria bacterium]|nr:Na+/H+ antiporter NhaA [Gammaproteobacteria bacterium]